MVRTVDARGIPQTTGYPWGPRTVGFVFEKLVPAKDGQVTEFDPGDLLKVNASAIAELLKQRGVTVHAPR